MSKRRLFFNLFVIVLALAVLAACTAEPESESTGSPASGTASGTSGAGQETQQEDGNFQKTGYPIVKEPVTLKVATLRAGHHGDWNDMETLHKLQQLTNVRIEWEQIPDANLVERRNLMFASRELPDILLRIPTSDDVVMYGAQGLLIPLNDLIEEYAPNINRFLNEYPHIKAAITAPDGNIYALPWFEDLAYFEYRNGLFLNKEWLDALDLNIPETTEEFYEVLKAFKELDPNNNGQADVIPFAVRYANNNNNHQVLYGAFGVLNGSYDRLSVVNGKVQYDAVLDGYKEGLKYFHRLYSEGLIDQEAFTQDQNQYNAKGSNPNTIVYGAFTAFNGTVEVGSLERVQQYVQIPPLKGPQGDQLWRRHDNRLLLNFFSITNVNPHPEISVRWADAMNEGDMKFELYRGPFGSRIALHADDKIEELAPPEGESAGTWYAKAAPLNFVPLFFSREETQRVILTGATELRNEAYEMVYKDFIVPEEHYYPQAVYSTLEEAERLRVLNAEIVNYVSEMEVKFIVEGRIDEEWDQYLEELNKMGLEEKLSIHQQIYDRYIGN